MTFEPAAELRGPLYSPLVEAAIRLACQGHYHHFRKPPECGCEVVIGEPLPPGCVPYVSHLMGTAFILARLGASDTVLAAAVLHDYLEDVPDPDGPTTIREAVGADVLELVLAVTEDKRRHLDQTSTWDVRKREQIDRIALMPLDAVRVKAADLLHNLHSLAADLESSNLAEPVWNRLNAGPERQLWYYRGVLAATRARLGDEPLVDEVERMVSTIARFVPTES